jgi:DNA replication protein DnaC
MPDDRDPTEEIATVAAQLKLSTLCKEKIARLLERAETEQLSYSSFVLEVLRLEVKTRRERRLDRNLKRSKLNSVVDPLDDFDFSIRPKLSPRIVRELLHCHWVTEARNVLCVGRPGLGKTRVLKALGRAACEQSFAVRYAITATVLEELQAALADGSYRKTFQRYQRIDVLILDEFAYEPFDVRATQHIFRLISARHGLAPTLLAANTGFSKWNSLFPSEAQAVATVDRLIDNATILHFTGKSSRKPKDGSMDVVDDLDG